MVVQAPEDDKVVIQGDSTPDQTLIDGKVFTVFSATAGIIPDMDTGTIELQDVVDQTELLFAASAAEPYADAWEIRGSIAKADINQTLFLSFGVKDESGKDQWFCIYEDHMSRQRYYNWEDTAYKIDNKHVGFNQASTSFFWRETAGGGDKLDYILVLKDDVLKLYFGNEKNKMSLAWSLPLTDELFGGFEAGTKYIVGINTVDPCNAMITDVSVKNGKDVVELGGVVGGDNADVRIAGDKFSISSATLGVSYNGNQGTITIKETAKETENYFAAGSGKKYSDAWEMSGTITKEDISKSVFLSFGVRDSKGNSQWFCIYENAMARQRYANWADSKYECDDQRVIFNQAACSFFWKEAANGGQKLHYKIILNDDVLQAYFGNDKYDMTLAWYLPLTEKLFGGFSAGSQYQIGINTVDAIKLNFTNVSVKTGTQAAVVPEYVEGGRFTVLSKSSNVKDAPLYGTIEISDKADRSEVLFAASPYDLTDKAWELSGTFTKEDASQGLFLSFGVKAANGKDMWFCILEDCMARQRYWNWWDTKYLCDDEYVIFNQATTSFYWKEATGDHLNFRIVVKNDVLRAYFGNAANDMELAWCLPLTDELFGGFAPGSEYMLGITTVDPTNAAITDITVKTGDDVVVEEDGGETEDTSSYQFFVDSKTGGVKPAPADGNITVSGSVSESEIMFAANADNTYAKQWELTGTVTKEDISKNLFLSFGVRDHNAKTQWFCIYEDCLARQKYWNWADSKYPCDNETVYLNQAACDFFWKNNDADSLNFKLVLKNDVLEAYFGNSATELTLAWSLPLNDTEFGGFKADSAYQLGIATVDPCALTFTGVSVTTAEAINGGAEYDSRYDTSSYTSAMITQANKWNAQAKENVTTIFIGDSFFHQEAFFTSFADIYKDKEALCLGIGGTKTYHWVSMVNDWLTGVNPKNIVVNIGTNNMGMNPPYGYNEHVIAGLQELFTELQEKFPNSNIYWFTIALRSDMSREADKEIINSTMKAWCAERGIVCIDSPIEDPATDCSDGLHPNAASYVKYAEALAAAGCEILDVDKSDDKFFISGATGNVLPNAADGIISITNSGNSETYFAANAENDFSDSWVLSGTIEKENINNSLFLSFGVKDSAGKDQWFCIYENGMARQRYWNWADTRYAPDDVYVFYNQAATSFYWKEGNQGGEKLNFKLVLKDDVLKAYFGNDTHEMKLAWSLPLTDATFGGFTAGSSYQLGITTVDPCALTISNITAKTGDDVQDEDIPDDGGETEPADDKFFIASKTDNVTADAKNGKITTSGSGNTETVFAADAQGGYAASWEMTGTITKNDISQGVFLSFGVRDTSGKDMWFCILEDCMARQRYWNWWDTKYTCDNAHVIFNQAACSFYWKEADQGGEKLNFKIVLKDDELKAYFGNDKHDMALAWSLPLTESTFGGFNAGSAYQIGITTVDPCALTITDISVVTGDAVGSNEPQEPGELPVDNTLLNTVSGKYVSILGDSISTYQGVSNVGSVNTTIAGYNVWYNGDWQNVMSSPNETYWGKVITKYGMELLVNNSCGGNRMFDAGGTGITVPAGYMRAENLAANTGALNGTKPDIILMFMGTNDHIAGITLGELSDATYTNVRSGNGYKTPTSFTEAYIIGLEKACNLYPDAKILCFTLLPSHYNTNWTVWNAYNARIREISQHYSNVTLVDVAKDSGITTENYRLYTFDGTHPNQAGMHRISIVLEEALKGVSFTSSEKFYIASKTDTVTADPVNGTITTSGTGNTETVFAANAQGGYAASWEMTGTITKNDISQGVFLSFGVRDPSGKDMWFCILEDCMARQRYWNWWDTKYTCDNAYVIFNQAACSFYWKEANQGGEKLNYRLVIENDVLKVYFGNDKHAMALAWSLPLTETTFGGFTAGSQYQVGINTVDPCALTISDIRVTAQ